jgi:hypothetical protein
MTTELFMTLSAHIRVNLRRTVFGCGYAAPRNCADPSIHDLGTAVINQKSKIANSSVSLWLKNAALSCSHSAVAA